MRRLFLALGLLPLLAPAARADDAPPACAMATGLLVSQDQGVVTIACNGATEALGNQLADVLNKIMQDHLDPETVLLKLDEIQAVPPPGIARKIDDLQRQAIIKALVETAGAEIAIDAHPGETDSGDYAKELAQPLIMAGWQIQGHQILRTAPKNLDLVRGVALIVHDREAAPEKATVLKAALSAAHILVPLITDPTLAPDATMLWIGRRPVFLSAAPKTQ